MYAAAAAVVFREPIFDPSKSVSQTWSRSRRSYWLIGLSYSVFGAGLTLSLLFWLIPTYHLAIVMYPITALSYLALLLIAWVPIIEKPGEHSLKHPHFIGGALVASGAVVAFIAIMAAQPAVPLFSRWLTIGAFVYAACWPLFMSVRLRKHFLYLEVLLATLFVAVISSLLLRL